VSATRTTDVDGAASAVRDGRVTDTPQPHQPQRAPDGEESP
jgi:hypothetical protein